MSEYKELDNWLSVSEASKLSGYGMDWLRELVKDEKITGIKKGHMILIDRQSLLDYKANEDKKTQVN
jgi:excisionase family DNA binding protein